MNRFRTGQGPRMLMSLSIHLHGLHLDAQQCLDMTSVDTITQWREDWSSDSVLNHTIRQPGFHLPRHTWSPMNRFRAGQRPM